MLLPLAHASNQCSRCFSEQHSPEHIPYLQGHSSGNTTCVTPGKFFCSFQLRMHAPVFPEKGSKAEELWLNKNTYLILPAAGKQSFSKVNICIDTLKPQSLVLLHFQGKQQSRKPRTWGSQTNEKGNKRAVTSCFCRLACRNSHFWEKAWKLLP